MVVVGAICSIVTLANILPSWSGSIAWLAPGLTSLLIGLEAWRPFNSDSPTIFHRLVIGVSGAAALVSLLVARARFRDEVDLVIIIVVALIVSGILFRLFRTRA